MTRRIYFDELRDMTIGELLAVVTGDPAVATDERWRNLRLGIDVANESGHTPAIHVSYFPRQSDDDPHRIVSVETVIQAPRNKR